MLRSRPRLQPAARAAFTLLVCLLAACSSPSAPSAPACPNDLPASCPSPAPAYADAAPILATHCTKCHGPGGVEAVRPLDSYDAVFKLRGPVLNQIYACVMPPAPEAPIPAAERKTVLAWLVCGAPP